MSILENINGHADLIGLSEEQLQTLCREVREALVTHVSQNGGHLASNLGVVELAVAIEIVFDTSKDRLVFDVGHQSYVHKLLTGRQAGFARLRKYGGVAGFPKPNESNTDAFVAGHASSSVSIALGMARARTLLGEDYKVVTLLGDGAATGGMVYEGLNDAAESNEPMVIILNDNAMSIDQNVGGMAKHLSRLRSKESYLGMKAKYKNIMSKFPGGKYIYKFTRSIKDWIKRSLIPTTIFENMGLEYLGPVDGHDLPNLIALLNIARDMKHPVLLHVLTQKGQGYQPAMENPAKFHGIGAFDPVTGEAPAKTALTFSQAFGEKLCELAAEDPRVCAITAAMPSGTGLLKFKEQYPKRTFDVGIAEEHAMSMAGGLAKQGMVPVVALYSTFLQRSYDMILQDVAILGLHVVICVDRAGLVGDDGETHHGMFDVGFLRQVPGLTLLAPGSIEEMKKMLSWAVKEQNGPVAIRYPRGGDSGFTGCSWNPEKVLSKGMAVCHREGTDAAIITYGALLDNALEASEILSRRGISASVIRMLSLSPLPVEDIVSCLPNGKPVVVLEEICRGSGVREELAWELHHRLDNCRVEGLDLGKNFVTHGDLKTLHRLKGLDAGSVADFVEEVCRNEN